MSRTHGYWLKHGILPTIGIEGLRHDLLQPVRIVGIVNWNRLLFPLDTQGRAMLGLLLLAGMHWEELCLLNVADLHLSEEGREYAVVYAWDPARRRTFVLPKDVVRLVGEYLDGPRFPPLHAEDQDALFLGAKGGRWDLDRLKTYFTRRFRRTNGVHRDVTLYSLRQSWLVAAWKVYQGDAILIGEQIGEDPDLLRLWCRVRHPEVYRGVLRHGVRQRVGGAPDPALQRFPPHPVDEEPAPAL